MSRHACWRIAVLCAPFLAGSSLAALPGPADLASQATAMEHGEGVTRDPVKAVELYCEAARLGDVDARYRLGWIYANGRGVARDEGLAALFFQLAAEEGHVQARNMLRFFGNPSAALPDCMKEKEEAVAGDPLDEEPILEQATPEQEKLISLVHRLAPDYSIHPRLALAVMRVESNFRADARSPKNAQGLMQLIPATARRFNVRNPLDPVDNLRGGLAYLRWLLAYFRGDVALATAGYNAGEKTVDRFLGIPPFAETRAYVRRIRELFPRDEHVFDPSITEASPALSRIRQRLAH